MSSKVVKAVLKEVKAFLKEISYTINSLPTRYTHYFQLFATSGQGYSVTKLTLETYAGIIQEFYIINHSDYEMNIKTLPPVISKVDKKIKSQMLPQSVVEPLLMKLDSSIDGASFTVISDYDGMTNLIIDGISYDSGTLDGIYLSKN
jgi:hypothetical protein